MNWGYTGHDAFVIPSGTLVVAIMAMFLEWIHATALCALIENACQGPDGRSLGH